MKKTQAIFAALNDEIKDFKSKVVTDERIHIRPSLVTRCQFMDKPCVLVRSGIGLSAISKAITYVISNFDVGNCINIGYCGGATPEMGSGDLVLATSVTDAETKKEYKIDEDLIRKVELVCKKKELKNFTGGVVTVNKVIKDPHEKAFIGTGNNALAIDMESSSFMERALHFGKKAFVVKVVLDPMDMILPDVGDLVDSDGEISIGQAACHLVSRPKDIFSLPKIEYCARKARQSITRFLEGWMESI